MPDVSPILLEIDDVEISGMEWSMTTEEVLGGVGRFKLNVQDRLNNWSPPVRGEVKVSIRESGWILGRGEIIKAPVQLDVGVVFRTWQFDCADVNEQMTLRLVGALDGKTWIDQYGMGFFVNIDPFATSKKTDKLTVQALFEHYFRFHGNEVDTEEFVGEYLTEFFPVTWNYKKFNEPFEQMAALIVENLQFWIDPDLKFHWVTIPAWYDLAQLGAEVLEDEGESIIAMGFGESPVDFMALAPAEAVDIDSDPDEGTIGFRKLRFDYDGANMPEQIYVRGGTGFVYNAPPIPFVDATKTVVKTPTAGAKAVYRLTFLATTKLWHIDNTGYISLTYDTVGASGPYNVDYIQVPWNESRNKGGGFWRLLNGPNSGKLVDNDTNVLDGYGEIEVVQVDQVPGTPLVGVGGSGWVNDVEQDPNKRQAFLEMPASINKGMRDSFGRQALYRGSVPTLRGSLVVSGIDGWRAGQLLRITDSRLPDELNGKYFVIQRVRSALLPGNDIREYTLDWGDGPESRFSGQRQFGPVGWPNPANQIVVEPHDLSPGPESTQIIVGQIVNGLGEPWGIAGKTVEWSFECYNNLGVLQTGQGSISPKVSVTDTHGKARTRLTTGDGDNLVYYVFARIKVT